MKITLTTLRKTWIFSQKLDNFRILEVQMRSSSSNIRFRNHNFDGEICKKAENRSTANETFSAMHKFERQTQ